MHSALAAGITQAGRDYGLGWHSREKRCDRSVSSLYSHITSLAFCHELVGSGPPAACLVAASMAAAKTKFALARSRTLRILSPTVRSVSTSTVPPSLPWRSGSSDASGFSSEWLSNEAGAGAGADVGSLADAGAGAEADVGSVAGELESALAGAGAGASADRPKSVVSQEEEL